MALFDLYRKQGQSLGLEGTDLSSFIQEKERNEREERREKMKMEAEKTKMEADEREKIRAHERALSKDQLEVQSVSSRTGVSPAASMKLPECKDEEDLCSYLSHFEKIFEVNNWDLEEDGVARLLPLLNRRMREIFVSLPSEATVDYSTLKAELLSATNLNPEEYRMKFRQSRIRPG